MTPEEITALAHEYAEEMHYGDNYFEAENKRLLTWLLRRYYLVEKETINKLLKEHCEESKGLDVGSREWIFYKGRLDLLESLFPEIGKEVEE